MSPTSSAAPARRRLLWATSTATALVVAATMLPSQAPERAGTFRPAAEAMMPAEVSAEIRALTEGVNADGHAHDHSDPSTKNAISRAGESPEDAMDPTTARQARANTAYVAKDRRSPAPKLRRLSLESKRKLRPQNRYAMANGCYALRAPNGRFLARSGTTLAATATKKRRAERFLFRAADLGVYLLYTKDRQFLGATSNGTGLVADPSPQTEWTARRAGGRKANKRYRLNLPDGRSLAANGGLGRPGRFRLHLANGCTAYPEVAVNVQGRPHGGRTSFQEVRGYIDPHTHGMAYEFLGGNIHCGQPWHRYGVAHALPDCRKDPSTAVFGGALDGVLSGSVGRDQVGWPTFRGWPAPDALTHEGTYYKWMERSWRGGLRILTNLLVENGQLCQLDVGRRNSCDDMDSVRLQAKRMREFQRYVDAQYGGPGKGWYRIVTSPWQARKVINSGRLAVVMGIETSVPFGCSFTAVPVLGDVPSCDKAAIDAQLDEMHRLGVRQMELVNKFDNALAGVAGDAGEVGVVINAANFLETSTFWDMRKCTPADGESADRTQLSAPDISAGQQDALFGAVAQLGLNLPALPLYPTPMHCNRRGLTDLGAHLIDRMVRKKWLIDPDHMSVKARQATLSLLERARYSGVISSHSWSTPDSYPRIYRLGGFVAPYAGDSTGFLAKWQRHLGWADSRYFFGFGFGADIGGLGAQGDPRGAGAPNKVTYPFTGLNGVKVSRQVSGRRVFDINVDGVAHYGLYPDWVEDLRRLGGARHGNAITTDLARGPEAYLQTWERAEGLRPDSCRNPGLRKGVKKFRKSVRKGMTTHRVMQRLGQPYSRIGKRFTYCAKTARKKNVRMVVKFKKNGKAANVIRKG